MVSAIVGAIAGLAIGVADWFVLSRAAGWKAVAEPSNRSAAPLRGVAFLSIFVFPIVGWFVGPILASSLGY